MIMMNPKMNGLNAGPVDCYIPETENNNWYEILLLLLVMKENTKQKQVAIVLIFIEIVLENVQDVFVNLLEKH